MVGIQKFLDLALFCPMGDTLIFGQMKGIMEIHNLFNFHRYSICGCHVVVKLNIFKVYRTQQKGGVWAAFGFSWIATPNQV